MIKIGASLERPSNELSVQGSSAGMPSSDGLASCPVARTTLSASIVRPEDK
jgi:hypothetical protein